MKKVFLSGLVIFTFLTYSLHRQLEGNAAVSNVGLPAPSPVPAPSGIPQTVYKDGQFTGDSVDAFYGNVQVQVTVAGGKITDVAFLDYPHDRRTSLMINMMATPQLKQEAIAAQNAQVDIVSGATQTSQAFIQSLQSALTKAA
ncbi:FMN-binding protein [Patescibacteria group bacterium]|nr:FMN-binding protein [Patescibacteria group bacterium]